LQLDFRKTVHYNALTVYDQCAELLPTIGKPLLQSQTIVNVMREYKPTKISGDSIQTVIEVYKKDVDRTMLRQALQLTVEERLLNLENFVKFAAELQTAGKHLRNKETIYK
jgi:hypothetical protein